MTPTTPSLAIIRANALLRRSAFTLAELMVTIGVILLVVIIALPAFTAIVGSRSVEAGRNLVAASIVRARGEAIRRGVPCGVFFYIDPDTGRTGAAIVALDPLTDPDPYDAYKSFHARRNNTGPIRDYQGGSYDPLDGNNATTLIEDEPSMTADRVVVLGQERFANDTDPNPFYNPTPVGTIDRYQAFSGRPVVLTMKHTSQDIDTAGAPNPGVIPDGDDVTEPWPIDNANNRVNTLDVSTAEPPLVGGTNADRLRWTLSDIDSIELIDGIEPNLLPAGVGLQMILGASLDPQTGLPGAIDEANGNLFRERYARYGLILFDSQGRLLQEEYAISAGSRLARVINVGATNPTGPQSIPFGTNQVFPTSQLGIVLFDADAFDSAASDGTALEWQGNAIASLNTAAILDGFDTSGGDRELPWQYFNTILPEAQPSPENEYAEERWLDANTLPLMVNRYSGTLVEAE